MKYIQQLESVRAVLPQANKILVVLPNQITVDKLASGLSLYLSLKQAGKEVGIVSEAVLNVGFSQLFGIGDIKNRIEVGGNGNLVITLEGVVDSEGKVPALEKLDWFPQGPDLNLVFHVLPGQNFNPRSITPKYSNSAFGLIFVIGASSLDSLGGIYTQNTQTFGNSQIVVINHGAQALPFGHTNVIDQQAGTLSEVVAQVISSLNLTLDSDSASNILMGIYEATQNLQMNVSADTLFAAGSAMQAGGRLPLGAAPVQPMEQQFAQTFSQGVLQPTPLTQPVTQLPENFVVPPVVGTQTPPAQPQVASSQTMEERPTGEYVSSGSAESPEATPAPDWLTPKVYRGGLG